MPGMERLTDQKSYEVQRSHRYIGAQKHKDHEQLIAPLGEGSEAM